MLELKKVAVTGGLSSGKSTVCQLFHQLGAYTVSADAIVHSLLDTHGSLREAISTQISPDVIADSKIDRSKLAEKVFQNPQYLEILEALIHPLVFDAIEHHYQTAKHGSATLFLAEIPLLFETGGHERFDATIAVIAPQESCIQRFTESTGYDSAEYQRRMQRQWSQEKKAAFADYVIVNDGDKDELNAQTLTVFNSLTL